MKDIMTSAEYNELQFEIKPRNKFKNIKVEIDGHKFDSKGEAKYYGKKKIQLLSGELVSLELQVKYPLVVNGVNIGFYKADFRETWKSGRVDVVDFKGLRTPVYMLKKKLMKALYGISIKEVK